MVKTALGTLWHIIHSLKQIKIVHVDKEQSIVCKQKGWKFWYSFLSYVFCWHANGMSIHTKYEPFQEYAVLAEGANY